MSGDDTLRQLTNAIVKGDNSVTEQVAKHLVEKRSSVTATLDTIINALNIVNDLHSIGEYDHSKVSTSCRAALDALQVLEPQLSIEESRAIGAVVLGCVPEDRVGFDRTMARSVLRAAGFKTFVLPTEVTYENLTNAVGQNQCDLAVLLIKTHQDDPRVQSLALELRESLLERTLRVLVGGNLEAAKICQKYAFTSYFTDLADLVSKVTEIIIKKRESL